MHSESSDFSWGSVFVTAFGPSILFGIAQGTILPVIALAAIDLGASYSCSGFIAALFGMVVWFIDILAALFTILVCECLSLICARFVSIVGVLRCLLSNSLWMLGCGVLMLAMSTSVFNLARQAY